MIDIIFAILIVIAIFKGYRKGFIIAIFSVLAFILGLAAALKLSATIAGQFIKIKTIVYEKKRLLCFTYLKFKSL